VFNRYIHWISKYPTHYSPIQAEVHAFNSLFNSANPVAHPEGFLADINPNSEEVFPNALLDIGFQEVKSKAPWPAHLGGDDAGKGEANGPESVRFQGMRVGYFCEDKDSTPDRVVLNRIVTLKADPGKAS
jgi:glutaminyl-tRNA synthetase